MTDAERALLLATAEALAALIGPATQFRSLIELVRREMDAGGWAR